LRDFASVHTASPHTPASDDNHARGSMADARSLAQTMQERSRH
jgi:hypothetical protein